jgi:hypothetical protein
MYSKTSLGADQLDGPALSPRGKKILIWAGGAVLAAGIGVGVWAGVSADSWGASGNGCVNVTTPSTMGGQTFHYCGTDAKTFCRSAYAHSDEVSLAGRRQCALAGLTEAKVASAGG